MASKKNASEALANSTALTPITGTALASILDSARTLAKVPGTGGSVAREQGVTLITDRPYVTSEQMIPAAEVYFVDGAKPREDGPWLGEADKVAWRDPATGYECIMLRDRNEAFLSGYVGVPEGHPLWGWENDAVVSDIGIEVHGGLTYSQICEHGPSPQPSLDTESRRVCHVPEKPRQIDEVVHGSQYRVASGEHVWWFGFDCNHIYDLLPIPDRRPQAFLAAETAAVYRDDGYVVREITILAAQLRAIADGKPMPAREGPPLPAIGLDPWKGGRPW